jgi:hypothetical protein
MQPALAGTAYTADARVTALEASSGFMTMSAGFE